MPSLCPVRQTLGPVQTQYGVLHEVSLLHLTFQIFNMATFGECFELCKISKEAELIGVEGHSKNDHVILTFTDKVLVYNVSIVLFS